MPLPTFKEKVSSISEMICTNCLCSTDTGDPDYCICNKRDRVKEVYDTLIPQIRQIEFGDKDDEDVKWMWLFEDKTRDAGTFCSDGIWMYKEDELCYNYVDLYQIICKKVWNNQELAHSIKYRISGESSNLSDVNCKNCLYGDIDKTISGSDENSWCYHVDAGDFIETYGFCPKGQWVFSLKDSKAPEICSFSYVYEVLYRAWSSIK